MPPHMDHHSLTCTCATAVHTIEEIADSSKVASARTVACSTLQGATDEAVEVGVVLGTNVQPCKQYTHELQPGYTLAVTELYLIEGEEGRQWLQR